MESCTQANSEVFETMLKTVQQVNSKFDCDKGNSGEVAQVLRQSNLEFKRCESFTKQDRPPQNAGEALNLKNENSIKSSQDAMEVYAIVLKLFSLVVGFGLKISLKNFEIIHRVIGKWIQLLCSDESDIDEEHDFKLNMDFCKTLKLRSYWICLPLTFLVFAFIISFIFLTVVKLLLFKVRVKNSFK